MKLFCDALSSGKYIPAKYANKGAGGGQNVSLPFSWTDIPGGTKSFALSMVDRHPSAKGFVHWLVINMSANARGISEGVSQNSRKLPAGSVELRNGFGSTGYGGPLLPKGTRSHEYLITLFALSTPELQLGPISPFVQFQAELSGKILESANVTAIFGG
jgi:Raf kinase inhibitor-like YbhB/YbcL family protein